MAFDKYELWNTHTLLAVMREQEQKSTYWLDLLFPNVMTSEDEYVDFEKIPSTGRKLAPFVAPMANGRAIYTEGSRVGRFKPAYIKASDPVSPGRVLTKRPGSLLSPQNASPQARYDAIKADILGVHRSAVDRTWEWLAAKAAIDGKVTISGPDYPDTLVDFGRAAGHTIVLGAGARWGDAGVKIKPLLSAWSNLMHLAEFGGRPNRITMGVDAWAAFEAATEEGGELHNLLRTDLRGATTTIIRDMIGNDEVMYAGRIGTLDVYIYNDYYTVDGVVTPFMSAKDIVLSSPAVNGYRCFGAIMDMNARFTALPVFTRNYVTTGDTAVEQILTQSSPLMVPVNTNATLKATVVA
jgi:hypothetical protein